MPLAPSRASQIVRVGGPAASIGELLGGARLDAPMSWALRDGSRLNVYFPAGHLGAGFNQRLSVLGYRAGITEWAFHLAARGDALILGHDPNVEDSDDPALTGPVPDEALAGWVPADLPATDHVLPGPSHGIDDQVVTGGHSRIPGQRHPRGDTR